MLNKRSPMLWGAFARYTRWYLRRNFNAVRCSRTGLPPAIDREQPAIVYLNHPSWWDPLICLLLATTYWPDRKHFAPIDAEALNSYPMLNRLGFFGVERDTHRGAAEFLRAGSEILQQPGSMIWITVEGEFTDPRNLDRALMPGFVHLAKKRTNVAVIPLAIEYPFWRERRPEALCRFGRSSMDERELRTSQQALAIESIHQDPSAFVTLLEGRGGIQPLYDLWRRGAALLGGKPRSKLPGEESK